MLHVSLRLTIFLALLATPPLALPICARGQELYEPGPKLTLQSGGMVDQLTHGSSPVRHAVGGHGAEQVEAAAQSQSQAGFRPASPAHEAWDEILKPNAQQASPPRPKVKGKSFLDREKTTAATGRESAQQLISRISINLAFVLSIAFGFVLLVRRFQKGKLGSRAATDPQLDAFAIRQVLSLTHGASLYVVEGLGNKCLVAIDASGIKSVQVLAPTFEETLAEAEPQRAALKIYHGEESQSPSAPSRKTTAQKSRTSSKRGRRSEGVVAKVDDESSAEMDQRLIKLLLQNSGKAA